MVSEKTKALVEADLLHVIHPYCEIGNNQGIVVERGQGAVLYDTEGKEYIDLASQLMCLHLGYGRREIIEAAQAQLDKLQYITAFYGFANEANIQCSRKLAEITPGTLDHFLFTSGGSESTETAWKLARLYWYTKGIPDKFTIVSLYQAYHGLSSASMAATALGSGTFSMWRGFKSTLPPGFIHIPPYYCYRCPFGLEYPNCDIRCARFLEKVILSEGPEYIAAFVAEPHIGSGGVFAPPPEYWPMVREICDKYDVLLIADEVMSGFGRTGKMFAIQNWDVEPDIMTMAKGLTSSYIPFGAVAINDKVFNSLKGTFLTHGFTYSGHPVGSATASAAIDIYVKEKIPERVVEMGKYVRERLEAEFLPLPCVGHIGGMGLFLSIELVADKSTKAFFPALEVHVPLQVQQEALKRGLYIRTLGLSAMAICPPLTITKEEVDRALDILKPIIASIEPSGRLKKVSEANPRNM